MRFLMQVDIPVEAGNAGLLDGSLLPRFQSYLNDVQPEAVYSGIANGQRIVYLIVNVESSDKLPEIAEPLWLDMKADVHFIPVLNAEEFEKAGAEIQRVVQART